MEDLRHVLMVWVLHVLKVCCWSRCPYKFLCTSGVRRFLLVALFPGIWILSIFLSLHSRTFDFLGFGWAVQVSFVLVWLPCLSSTFTGLTPDVPNPAEDFLSRSTGCVTPSWWSRFRWNHWFRFRHRWTFTGSRFLTSLWHGALLILLEWLQENIEKLIMLNKRRRWFHSSRVKLSLVGMSLSWFLVSIYLIWILESRLIRSNSQSRATLWVLETYLIVGLLPFIIILMTASHSVCTCEFRTISFLTQAQETTNVRARIFVLPQLQSSQYVIFLDFLTQCRCTMTWTWSVLGIAQVHMVFQLFCSGSRWESAKKWILWNLSTRTPSAPRRFDPIIHKPIDLSPSMPLRDVHWFFPCTILNRRLRRLSLLTAELPSQSTESSFSNNVLASWSWIYLEFLSDLWPTFLSHRTVVLLFFVADFGWMQILQRIVSKMNCGLLRDNHEHSPYQRIHIEVLHLVFCLAHEMLSQVRVDFLQVWNVSTWYAVMVRPLRVVLVFDVGIFCGEFPRTFVHLCICEPHSTTWRCGILNCTSSGRFPCTLWYEIRTLLNGCSEVSPGDWVHSNSAL